MALRLAFACANLESQEGLKHKHVQQRVLTIFKLTPLESQEGLKLNSLWHGRFSATRNPSRISRRVETANRSNAVGMAVVRSRISRRVETNRYIQSASVP